jgi:hypothetical protein
MQGIQVPPPPPKTKSPFRAFIFTIEPNICLC